MYHFKSNGIMAPISYDIVQDIVVIQMSIVENAGTIIVFSMDEMANRRSIKVSL